MTPDQYNNMIGTIQWFYSPNSNTFQLTTWNDIAFNGDSRLIRSSFLGTATEAVTAAPGGPMPSPVVLGPDWFLDSTAREGAVMLHESVHSITGWSDADIFNNFGPLGLPTGSFKAAGDTDGFTQWLLKGCPPK
jgi:hypothetical protein